MYPFQIIFIWTNHNQFRWTFCKNHIKIRWKKNDRLRPLFFSFLIFFKREVPYLVIKQWVFWTPQHPVNTLDWFDGRCCSTYWWTRWFRSFWSKIIHICRDVRTISINVKTYIFLVYQLELTKREILSPHL